MGCCQTAETSHGVSLYFSSRKQGVRRGAGKELAVTLAFLGKGMFSCFCGCKVSFSLLFYCGHRVALSEDRLYSEKAVYV